MGVDLLGGPGGDLEGGWGSEEGGGEGYGFVAEGGERGGSYVEGW